MVDCVEILDQRLLDRCYFDQGQFAVIELTVEQFLHGDLIDKVLDARRGGFSEGTRSAFDCICDHQNSRFFGLRFWARVAEGDFGNLFEVLVSFILFDGLLVEVLDESRAVVLFDKVDNSLRNLVLPSQVSSVFDVCDDD